MIVKPNNKSIPISMMTGLENEMLYSECDTIEAKRQHNISFARSYTQPGPYGPKNFFEQSIIKKETHAYSSSDCGFSSASQNSINNPTTVNNSQYPQISSADAKIYERIISKLINSSTLTYDDTLKLKSLLVDGHNDQCCLHNKSILNNCNTTDMDQIIADVIKNSYLVKDVNVASVQRPTSTTCYQMNPSNLNMKSNFQLSNICKDTPVQNKDDLKESSYRYCQNDCCRHSPRSLIQGSTAESLTLSSNDSTNSSIAPSDDVEANKNTKIETRSNDNTILPKAFELKLTLSINNNDKTNISSSSDDTNKPILLNDPSILSNVPKLDINISPEFISGDVVTRNDKYKTDEAIDGNLVAN